MRARIVDHVYAQVAPGHGNPTHPEDVECLRSMIAEIVGHTLGYLDDHAEPVRWEDES